MAHGPDRPSREGADEPHRRGVGERPHGPHPARRPRDAGGEVMRLPVRTDLATLLAGRQPPCVSLYLATDRSYPAEQQGPIRYKNAITAAEEMLRQQYPGHQVNDLLDRFR